MYVQLSRLVRAGLKQRTKTKLKTECKAEAGVSCSVVGFFLRKEARLGRSGDLDSVAISDGQSACVPARHGRVTRFLSLGWRQPGRATSLLPTLPPTDTLLPLLHTTLHALFLPPLASSSANLLSPLLAASPLPLFTRTGSILSRSRLMNTSHGAGARH